MNTTRLLTATILAHVMRITLATLKGSTMRCMMILALAGVILAAVFVAPAGAQEVLPKPEPAFKGTIGKTYKDSKADFPKPLQAPAGAPNVLIVLLDDVGFGHAATFGGAVATPDSRSACQERTPLQSIPHHGALLAHASRAADRPQSPQCRHGRDHRVGHRVSGLHRRRAQHGRRLAGDASAERLLHGRLRQMAQHAGQRNHARQAPSTAGRPERRGDSSIFTGS